MKTTKMIKSFLFKASNHYIIQTEVSSYGGTIITLLLLGFPESSLGFFCKMLWKKHE